MHPTTPQKHQPQSMRSSEQLVLSSGYVDGEHFPQNHD